MIRRSVARGLVRVVGAAALGLTWATLAASADEPGRTTLTDPAIRYTVPDRPYVILRRGEVEAVEARTFGRVIGMDRTPQGRIWACWDGGGDDESGFFVAATSDDGRATWSRPRLVIDPTDPPGPVKRRTLVGNFWTDPSGTLWLFFDQSTGYFDGRAGVWATSCGNPDADAPQWSAPRRL